MKRRPDTKWTHLGYSSAPSWLSAITGGAQAASQDNPWLSRLALRTDLHLARKAWHLLMGLLMVAIYALGMERSTAVVTLSCVLTFNVAMEVARLRFPALNAQVMRIMGPIMRSHEAHGFSAVPHYILATLIAIAIFPKTVAILGVLYLACGDPIASLFGILYGERSIRLANGKSLVGTAAGVITCAIVTLLVLSALGFTGGTLLFLVAVGGLVGGSAELLPLDLDDNLTIPVVSGFAMWLAFILVGA